MRIEHQSGYSLIQGKRHENEKILRWIALANAEIMVDECEDDEISYTVVSKSPHTTQKERSEDFADAKKRLKKEISNEKRA